MAERSDNSIVYSSYLESHNCRPYMMNHFVHLCLAVHVMLTHNMDSHTLQPDMRGYTGGWPYYWTLAGIDSGGHCHSGGCSHGLKGAVTSQCTPCCSDLKSSCHLGCMPSSMDEPIQITSAITDLHAAIVRGSCSAQLLKSGNGSPHRYAGPKRACDGSAGRCCTCWLKLSKKAPSYEALSTSMCFTHLRQPFMCP